MVRDNAGNFYGTASIGGAGGDGVVYELSLTQYGWVETVLHSFDNGADGGLPYGGLVMDSAGNLYGATQAGSHGAVVYELSPSNGGWSFQVLYHFASGVGPNAALTLDAAGNLYGTTEDVGAHGAGMVFKLTNANGVWNLTDLHDFSGGSGSYPYGRSDPRRQRQSLRHHVGRRSEWVGRGVEDNAVSQRPGGRGLRSTAYPLAAVNDYWRKIAWLLKKSLS